MITLFLLAWILFGSTSFLLELCLMATLSFPANPGIGVGTTVCLPLRTFLFFVSISPNFNLVCLFSSHQLTISPTI